MAYIVLTAVRNGWLRERPGAGFRLRATGSDRPAAETGAVPLTTQPSAAQTRSRAAAAITASSVRPESGQQSRATTYSSEPVMASARLAGTVHGVVVHASTASPPGGPYWGCVRDAAVAAASSSAEGWSIQNRR